MSTYAREALTLATERSWAAPDAVPGMVWACRVMHRYMDPEDDVRESYWDDVKLQMVCKMWAQEYNKCQPPKQVRLGATRTPT